ncbi:MAG: hypothetical protein ACYSWP_01495 [Planctomycetota bacterium]|jgi:hypothetical protein
MIIPITLLIAISLAVATFIVPRKYFLVPYIIATCFVPDDQRIIIMGLDFTVLRILIVIGVLRIYLQGENRVIRWGFFDKIFFAWAICGAIVYMIQWADMKSLILKCGVLFDIIGFYWLFRQSVRSWNGIYFISKVLAICVLIMAPLLILEWKTGNNPFRLLGTVVTQEREGRYRCMASFGISILMGLFWATLVPLFVALAKVGKEKLLYWTAVAASIFAVIVSASSTPLCVLLLVLLVLCLFKFRQYVSYGLWGLIVLAIALHLVMKAPVWHLVARINVVGGSTGWHRFHLIDTAIAHYREWILLGTRSTGHWGHLTGDIANQYLLEGVRGGLLTLILFIAMLVTGFKTLIKYFQKSPVYEQQFLAWCLFVSLLGHCFAFIGVSYFGQIVMLWYLMLSIIGLLNEKIREIGAAKYKPI